MDDQDEKRDEFPAGFPAGFYFGDEGWLNRKGFGGVQPCQNWDIARKKAWEFVGPAVEEATKKLREELAEKEGQVAVLKEVVGWREAKRGPFGKSPADPARMLRDQVVELHAQLGEIRAAFDELREHVEKRGEAAEDSLAIVDEPAQEMHRLRVAVETLRKQAENEKTWRVKMEVQRDRATDKLHNIAHACSWARQTRVLAGEEEALVSKIQNILEGNRE